MLNNKSRLMTTDAFGPVAPALLPGTRLKDGGAEGSRTPDLLIANEALYQLSYDPIVQAGSW